MLRFDGCYALRSFRFIHSSLTSGKYGMSKPSRSSGTSAPPGKVMFPTRAACPVALLICQSLPSLAPIQKHVKLLHVPSKGFDRRFGHNERFEESSMPHNQSDHKVIQESPICDRAGFRGGYFTKRKLNAIQDGQAHVTIAMS